MVTHEEIASQKTGFPIVTSSRKGLLLQSDYFDKKSVQENVVFHVLPPGFITYRHMSDDSIFHFNRNSLGQSLLVSKEYPVFRAQSGLNANFLLSELNHSSAFAKFSGRQKKGGTRTRLYFGVLTTFSLSAPSRIEQDQISRFIETLDSLVVAHERKLELLKKKKNYYLQQIFSQKIRLKGFNDPWKQRKLLSCVEKILDFRGRTPKKLGLKWSTSGSLALSALNVKQGYIDKEVPTYHGDCQLYKRWMGDSTLHKGQVVFTTEAPMGNVAQIPDNEKYILSQRTIAFELSAKILQDSFLALLLISPEVRKMLMQKTSGATAQGISQKTLAELVLSIPNLTEQNYVSSFFQVLNELIYMEQRKQTLLKQQKQAYLQKMFV